MPSPSDPEVQGIEGDPRLRAARVKVGTAESLTGGLIAATLTSVPGAIVGGLIIGASEKLAEVYLGPMVGGGIEGWFPYVLALLFLLVRPEGLFGEKIIRRI